MARKILGDPRISVLQIYKDGSVEREAGLLMAYEPATWHYMIPWFSRNHPPAIGQLKLLSSTCPHFISLLLADVAFIFISYFLLVSWSFLAAIVVATILFLGIFALIANYRFSKHYSIYFQDGKLGINNAWWALIVIELNEISSYEIVDKKVDDEKLCLGRGMPNIQLVLSIPQRYYSFLGITSEKISELFMCVDQADSVVQAIKKELERANHIDAQESGIVAQ